MSTLTPKDFGYRESSERNEKKLFLEARSMYVQDIKSRFSTLIRKHVAGKTLKGQLASGGLGELSFVIVIEDYIEKNMLNVVSKHVATEATKRLNKGSANMIGDAPVDIQIRDKERASKILANIQIKKSLE